MTTGEACEGSHSDKTAALAFRMSALHERARLIVESAREAVEKAVDAVETVMRNVRGPDPDFDEQENTRETMRILRQLITRPLGNNYHEGGDGSEKKLLGWLLIVTGSLTVAAIVGGVSMYGKLTAIQEGMNGHEQRIDRLERLNERRYRGADASP
jgi:hypothetical protein